MHTHTYKYQLFCVKRTSSVFLPTYCPQFFSLTEYESNLKLEKVMFAT